MHVCTPMAAYSCLPCHQPPVVSLARCLSFNALGGADSKRSELGGLPPCEFNNRIRFPQEHGVQWRPVDQVQQTHTLRA